MDDTFKFPLKKVGFAHEQLLIHAHVSVLQRQKLCIQSAGLHTENTVICLSSQIDQQQAV